MESDAMVNDHLSSNLMLSADDIYTAGLFDGEGTVSLGPKL